MDNHLFIKYVFRDFVKQICFYESVKFLSQGAKVWEVDSIANYWQQYLAS